MQNRSRIVAIALRAAIALFVGARISSAQDTAPDKLAVKRVLVYDTGVAFIEHEGRVSGNQEITLDLPDRDVNDLLKSMVVKDLSGGRVSWAAMPTSTSKTPPIQLGNRNNLSELLLAMRGMRVRVGSASPVEGELLLVENRTVEKTKEIVPMATVLTAAGLVRVDVKNGDAVALSDESQRSAITRSATLLDTTLDLNATKVRLQCEGEGDRSVRVGYITAAPIWKASYRLVLKAEGNSVLQAWALVENATVNDWNEIECTLVSGRGLGFQTDLRTRYISSVPTARQNGFR